MRWLILAALSCAAAVSPVLARAPVYGPNLEGFDYPYPVRFFALSTQAQRYGMAYMDVAPRGPGAGGERTVVLLAGRRFCGATWAATIAALAGAGFRVVVPDQLGFCKSSKPVNYQYSFEQLATNTRRLLGELRAGRIILVGHGMGGMLAARYALSFPRDVTELVLVDPLGLAAARHAGALYLTIDERYALTLENDAGRIERYERERYYGGRWKPSYDVWVRMLASLYTGTGRERYAWNQALVADMIFTQPIVHALAGLAMPTVIVVGSLDRTLPFDGPLPPAAAARLPSDVALARRAVARIPDGKLIELAGVGHVPQIEASQRFNRVLLRAIEHPPARHSPQRRSHRAGAAGAGSSSCTAGALSPRGRDTRAPRTRRAPSRGTPRG